MNDDERAAFNALLAGPDTDRAGRLAAVAALGGDVIAVRRGDG